LIRAFLFTRLTSTGTKPNARDKPLAFPPDFSLFPYTTTATLTPLLPGPKRSEQKKTPPPLALFIDPLCALTRPDTTLFILFRCFEYSLFVLFQKKRKEKKRKEKKRKERKKKPRTCMYVRAEGNSKD
jgi:hypothetical protein